MIRRVRRQDNQQVVNPNHLPSHSHKTQAGTRRGDIASDPSPKTQILNTETLIRQLVYDEATGKLSVEGTANQDTPALTKGKVVMFGLDVWEHGEIRSCRD